MPRTSSAPWPSQPTLAPTTKAISRARPRDVWSDGASIAAYERGALCPGIAKLLYGSTSRVLIEKDAKSLIWVEKTEEALAEETQSTLEKARIAVEEYKESWEF
ncbi:hypothetical protein B296_00001599 [Ensete ventricosum]|uniref:Uncharacterized protein n=1 Tax=Ensete ventricosum TaxID=4639 RepID=A0A427AEV4_ENSVE|nr:hypothetical protein B296_00001599 [Ensete ventricosum]